MSDPILNPCPFCRAGQTDVRQVNEWRAVLTHFCDRHNYPQPVNRIVIHGSTVADAVAQWNRRPGCP